MQTPQASVDEFGGFQLDPAKRLLRRIDGTPVPLTPRVFDTLLYLVEHHDAVLDKERIMEAVWPDSIVEENNLTQAIWKLRQVFGETPGSRGYIVTVPGRGYRFAAEVNNRPTGAAPVPGAEPLTTEASIYEATRKAFGSQMEGGHAAEAPPPNFAAAAMAGTKGKKAFGAAVAVIVIISLAILFFVRYRSLSGNVQAPRFVCTNQSSFINIGIYLG